MQTTLHGYGWRRSPQTVGHLRKLMDKILIHGVVKDVPGANINVCCLLYFFPSYFWLSLKVKRSITISRTVVINIQVAISPEEYPDKLLSNGSCQTSTQSKNPNLQEVKYQGGILCRLSYMDMAVADRRKLLTIVGSS